MPKPIRNLIGLEDLAAAAGRRIASGTPPEVAKASLVAAAAAPYQDWTRDGLANDAMDTPGNVGQVVRREPTNI